MSTVAFTAAAALTALTAAVAVSNSHITALCRSLVNRRSHLAFTPSRLRFLDLLFIVLAVIWKSVLNLFGQTPRLTLSANGDCFELPAIQISAPVEVQDIDISRYRDAVAVLDAGRGKNKVSEPQPLLLVALTSPLMMLITANYRSPILPLGSVNTSNRFEYLAADLENFLDKSLHATASFGGPQHGGRRTRRGVEFDIVIELKADGVDLLQSETTASSGQVIFHQRITIMQTLPRKMCLNTPKPSGIQTSLMDPASPITTNEFQVPYHAPRAWARLCKDYNPIHVSALAAQAFGYPGRMAHGNHVACQILAIVSRDESFCDRKLKAVEVAFKRPMVLPMVLKLAYQVSKDGKVVFELTRGEKVHVLGHIVFQ